MTAGSDSIASTAASRLSCVRRWPSDAARRWSIQFVDDAMNNSFVDAIVAIGSAVRGTSFSADVDFIVIFHDMAPRLPQRRVDVDLRGFRREKVEELLTQGHELLAWAVKFGCVVFERKHYWTELCSKWQNRVPLPSATVASERARKAERLFRQLEAAGDDDAAQEQRITMLTHRARARLIYAGVYPVSRPELPAQLAAIGEHQLAAELADLLKRRAAVASGYTE